ncbi:MAG: hypothetical protein ACRDIL_07450 [Candidatus Limnocylindrales bacterium]
MRVRRLGLRLIGVALAGAWATAAAFVLFAYRPGGPLDLVVGVSMTLPLAIALSAILWPPLARGRHSHAAMVALGVGTLLVLVPSIGGLLGQLQARGSQTLIPSLEAAYPWFLALFGTSLFAGFGLARRLIAGIGRRRHRLRIGLLVAAALTLVAGTAFSASAIANEGLRDRTQPATASRFGPTVAGDDEEPPPCDGRLAAGDAARLGARFIGYIDGRQIGSVDLAGQRAGQDFRWLAYVATNRELGQYGAARRGADAWVRTPSAGWQSATTASVVGASLDLEATRRALAYGSRATSEDRGTELIEGARARRCRVAVDGAMFRATFPQVRWLVGEANLAHWRGQLDYWIFLDGELGQITGSVNGEAGDIRVDAIQGKIDVRLTATERDRAIVIGRPAR